MDLGFAVIVATIAAAVVGGLTLVGRKLLVSGEKSLVTERMPLGKHDYKIAGTVAGGIFVVVVVAYLFVQAFFITSPVEKKEIFPGAQAPTSSASSLNLSNEFGPFKLISPNVNNGESDTDTPAVLVLGNDQSTRSSSKWTINTSAAWPIDKDNVTIVGITVEGDVVKFRNNHDRIFKVGVKQPFLWNDEQASVYYIDVNRQVRVLSINEALKLRRTR